MLCIIPESSLGKSLKHLIWTQSRWQRSPSPFVSSFGLCVHKNMLAPHVYWDKCNVKPRLRHNYVMYSLHLFAQIYMLTTDCDWGPLITDPPTAQSRAIRGKWAPNETMKIMNSRWWWIVRSEVWNATAFVVFLRLSLLCILWSHWLLSQTSDSFLFPLSCLWKWNEFGGVHPGASLLDCVPRALSALLAPMLMQCTFFSENVRLVCSAL